ncbi:hypothetical protein [Erythrobacter sp. SG61-1L]|uniref:hypothetical protein n=1 Tax=Erythrobacter sp. SG61-1L TaxID=1603897 RepID=UPI000A735B65|nr:hypothetical protein [Erythrobacter sp. SG61-1L]
MGMEKNIVLENLRFLHIFILLFTSLVIAIPVSIISYSLSEYSFVASCLSIELLRFGYVFVCRRWLGLISTPSLMFSIALVILSILFVLAPDYESGLIEVSYVNLVFVLSAAFIGFCSGMIYLFINLKDRSLVLGFPPAFLMMASLYATNPLLGRIGGSLLGELVFKACFLFTIMCLSVYLHRQVKAAIKTNLSK